MKTISKRFKFQDAKRIINELMVLSQWFQVNSQPFGWYEITIKEECKRFFKRKTYLKENNEKTMMTYKKKLCDKAIEVASNIGQFFLQKNNCDYEKTAEEINKIGFTKVAVVDNKVCVVVKRPGMLIGRRGEIVNSLEKWLSVKLKIEETEPSETDFLIPSPAYQDNYEQNLIPSWEEQDNYDYYSRGES